MDDTRRSGRRWGRLLWLGFFSIGAVLFLVTALQTGSVLRWVGFALNVFCVAGAVVELQDDDRPTGDGDPTS